MSPYALDLAEIRVEDAALVGGKGANLAELSRIDGLRVPRGFCVTTEAYRRTIARAPGLDALLGRLGLVRGDDRPGIAALCARIRSAIEEAPIAPDIAGAIFGHLERLDSAAGCAVRSSATAEDLPTASFAGQQDTYLNIRGRDAILRHVSRCWASLFTDRAVIYRIENGFAHDRVQLSVVIQEMVFPEAAGILFTADPVTSNRRIVSIDASPGLGEALVSGVVDADLYRVQDGRIVTRRIAAKALAIRAAADGGTRRDPIPAERQSIPTLTDPQILDLAGTGRRIEAHFGCPQDIEWCLRDGAIHIVQSRPITTLYPVPPRSDGHAHVYMSLAHQQMMTDVMSPLGLSFFPIWLKGLTSAPVVDAGGRLYLDASYELRSPLAARVFVRSGLGSVDPLTQRALSGVLRQRALIRALARGRSTLGLSGGSTGQLLGGLAQARRIARENDPGLLRRIIDDDDARVRELEARIGRCTGPAVFDFIVEDMAAAFRSIVLDRSGVAIAGILAANWLKKHLGAWLGETEAVDVLSQGLANNVTSEMGLGLLDVADVVRAHPAVVAYLQRADDATFFEQLARVDGGDAVGPALRGYLDRYGARCPGEIDIARPRWAERPTLLTPLILNNIQHFGPNSRAAIAAQGRTEAERRAQEITARLEALPGGRRKARRTRAAIGVMRNFIGFREFPKYALMRRFLVYKGALRREAERLVERGLIAAPEESHYLRLDEFREAVRTGSLDPGVVTRRRADAEAFARLTPPRVMTSDGEIIGAEYDGGDAPEGALIGVPVSAGVVEGRARIVLDLEHAAFEEGDILVTAFTDPSWTPVFVSIRGLVTEVGGMMTHGAVVAREYGLPAVVSVERATTRIADGRRIRVNGTRGYVEILP